MTELKDSSIMWFGKHKGKALESVPADYLLWLHREGKCPPNLKKYIEENKDVLEKELKRKR